MPAFTGRKKSGFENMKYAKAGSTTNFPDAIDASAPVFFRDLTPGTGANQANFLYRDEVTIASGGTFVLDLSGGAQADVFGTVLAMTSLVGLMVINDAVDDSVADNTTNITLTTTLAGIFGGTSPSVILKPGELFERFNANAGGLCAVTAGTADQITFTNAAGASARVQICAIGRG